MLFCSLAQPQPLASRNPTKEGWYCALGTFSSTSIASRGWVRPKPTASTRFRTSQRSTTRAAAAHGENGETSETSEKTAPIMEVTRDNFTAVLPTVVEALSTCSFYAFDCEMTGLFVSENRSSGLAEGKPPAYIHDIEDRYEELVSSSSAFVINQFGLSVFHEETKDSNDDRDSSNDCARYTAKTFNFYTFPRPFEEHAPRFLSEAGSLQFLSEHKFDFNKWIYGGISYMPGKLRDRKLKALEEEGAKNNQRSEIVPTTEVDKMMVADLVKDVRAWLADSDAGETLLLSPVNSYQRALQYQELRKDQFGCDPATFPGFYPEKVEIEGTNRAMIKLTRATGEEIARREREMAEARRQAVHDAAGFAAVLDAMRESGKPAVGHNLAFDIAYSIHSFVEPLPASWEEFRGSVVRQFPGGIFDTKLISQNFVDQETDTSLGPLYGELTNANESLVGHAEGYDMYDGLGAGEAAHDAGYDAFMTGAVFAHLLQLEETRKVGVEDEEDDEEGQIEGELSTTDGKCVYFPTMANRMYVTGSDLAYASFAGSQDYPARENIVYVRDIPQGQQVRRGNDLARNLGKKNPLLMGSRVTTLEYGAKALIEFQDAAVAQAGMEALQEMFGEEVTVAEYAAFREERRERLVTLMGGNGKKRKSTSGAPGASPNGTGTGTGASTGRAQGCAE